MAHAQTEAKSRESEKTTASPTAVLAEARRLELRGEMLGIVLTITAVAFGVALGSYTARDMEIMQSGRGSEGVVNLIGPVGARIADLLLQALGLGAFLLDGLLFVFAVRTLMGKVELPRPRAMFGIAGASLASLVLLHLVAQSVAFRPFGKDAAGLLPGAVAVVCKALVSTVGTTLLAVLVLGTSLAAITGRSLVRSTLLWATGKAAPVVGEVASQSAQAARGHLRGLGKRSWFRRRRDEDVALTDGLSDGLQGENEFHFTVKDLDEPAQAALPETAVVRVSMPAPDGFPMGESIAPPNDLIPSSLRRAREEPSVRVRMPAGAAAEEASVHPSHAVEVIPPPPSEPFATSEMDVRDVEMARAELEEAMAKPMAPTAASGGERVEAPAAIAEVAASGELAKGPRIVETEATRNAPLRAPVEAQGSLGIGKHKSWELPPSTLLREPPSRVVNCDHITLRENALVLEQKLRDFNITGEVTDIRPGPVVTTYEYRPAAGIKISKIVNLRDDLTMSLSALRVRVVAPIPGRDVVGIEVPNAQRQLVYFREIVDSPVFRDSASLLTLILGKDIEGRPLCTDLARAPHLLVAGATGTGKSVGINSFICSMLFRATPDEVRFIFIDPKVLELSVYEGIPHLLLPVLDEPHKAELALKWAVTEMDRRYRLLAAVEVRNLAGYKQKLPELRAQALRRRAAAERLDAEGQTSPDVVDVPEDMPYIVIVIDEFADLIMASGKEVEHAVARLAQKARAAGIHVVLATQRPSVDVITGLIKANFPTRLSFQVASSMDSKVVLGSTGAETLLGKGDMLFVPPGEGHLKRCHGTWITDEEVVELARHWKEQGAPVYDMDILRDPEVEAVDQIDDGELDPLYDEAVQVVIDANQASVSFLQRKLGIGYGRSARIVDTMEARGIVGPSRGPNKPREIMHDHL
ncbi:MAG: DNA translocase FtsK 4TM domain-containing protein [Myxococcota bacterium]